MLYDASVPLYERGLGGLRLILDKAELQAKRGGEAHLLALSIADRLNPVTSHVQAACRRAALDTRQVVGLESVRLPKTEPSFRSLFACIDATRHALAVIDRAAMDAVAADVISLGSAEKGTLRAMTGFEFLLTNSLPQFFFHLTNVYLILRANGIDLRKPDFLGGD